MKPMLSFQYHNHILNPKLFQTLRLVDLHAGKLFQNAFMIDTRGGMKGAGLGRRRKLIL